MKSRLVSLSFLTLLVWWVGRRLPAPPFRDPGAVGRWWRQAGALMAVFGLIRMALLAVAVVWGAALLAAAVPQLRAALARAAEGSWLGRPMMRLALGLTAAGATAGGCSTGGHAAPSAPLIVGLGLGPGTKQPAAPIAGSPERAAHTGATTTTARPPTAQPAAPAPVRVNPPTPSLGRWVVRPGDDLWSIAAATVTARSGNPAPPERVVAAYWLEVIQANRGWLADPNLIFPGDVVALPPSG